MVDPVKAKGTIMDLKYLDADGNNISDPKAVMSLDYAAMSSTDASGLLSKLNAGGGSFGMVTVTENGGQAINGKYSFPGSDKELIGQNYPFPTVITQEDPFDSTKTVNVHYGQWPKGTDIYSDASSMTLDLVSNSAGTHDCTANVAVKFYTESSAAAMTAEPVIGFKSTNDGTSDGSSSDIVKCSLTASTTENGTTVPQYYILTIDGWKEGYETVSISYTLNGKTYKTYINLAVTAELNIKTWSADSTSSQPKVGTIVSYKANVYDRNFDNTKTDNKAVSGLTAHNWTAVTADTNIAEVKSSDLALDADGNIVIPVIGNKAGRTTLTITVSGIRPANYRTISGVTDTRSLTQTYSMDINVTEADALPASILIYADGKRIDTADKAVSVASGKTIADDSTSLANFNYWTEQVAAADSGYSLGRTFAGWITEDGKSVDQSTSFKTTTSIYASWKCTKLTFTDEGTECGSLYYYGGSFYKSSTLTDKADTAPQPSVHSGDETFAGYQFAADTETGSSMVKLTDSDCKLIDGALSGLTVGGATIDENMAELKVQAVFTDDTAVQP